jgi:hypothetical protein
MKKNTGNCQNHWGLIFLAFLTSLLTPNQLWAQFQNTADASAYDLISYEQLVSIPMAHREAYLQSVRQILGELAQRRQNSEVFAQQSDHAREPAWMNAWQVFALQFTQATQANPCPAGMELTTLNGGGSRATVCRLARRDSNVSDCLSRPGTMIVHGTGRASDNFYGAHCILASDADELRNLRGNGYRTESGPHSGSAYREDGQVLPPESRPARAPAVRTDINPESEDIHQACRSTETTTPEQRRQRLEAFRAHARQNGGTCLHGGNLSRYGGTTGDFNTSSVRAGNCRGRSSFEVSGIRVQCSNSSQTLCNPLIYGMASVTQDEPAGTRSAVGRCVPRSANATKACDDRFGQAEGGESAAQFISRGVPGIREAYEDFRRNLASFCNTPVSREAHCEECRVLRERIFAANRGVRAARGGAAAPGAPGGAAPVVQ